MKFIIIELDDDGSILEPWQVEAEDVKEALQKFAIHTDLNNLMEDYEEDFVNAYNPDTKKVSGDFEVLVFNIAELKTIK